MPASSRNYAGNDSSDKAWRLFVAIEVPVSIREQLATRIQRLRELVPGAHASWSRPDNIHLTLKFIGEIPPSRSEELSAAASETAQRHSSFSVSVTGCGAFPPRGAPRVLWIGLESPEGHLARLHADLDAACAKLGFEKEARRFHPHLTLARLRRPEKSKALAQAHAEMDFKSVDFTVDEILVIRSELSSAGSKYTVISRHPLQSRGNSRVRGKG